MFLFVGCLLSDGVWVERHSRTAVSDDATDQRNTRVAVLTGESLAGGARIAIGKVVLSPVTPETPCGCSDDVKIDATQCPRPAPALVAHSARECESVAM
jgi:hypothetical protein